MSNEIIIIEKIITGGDGLGYIEGKAHFVPGTLPGESVEIEILEKKKGFNRCRVLSIVKRSSKRIDPFCPLFTECGGCNLQYTDYQNQLEIKRDILQDIFIRNGKIELGSFDFVESVDTGYRNRIQLHSKNGVTGFKRSQSNEIIKVEYCPLLVDGLNKKLSQDIISGDQRLNLFSDGDNCFIAGIDKKCSVNILGREVQFSPQGFFQSNISILPELIKTINRYIIGSSVMDLYCGVGLFSIFLPESVENIIAVERDQRVEPYVNANLQDRKFNFYPMSLENYLKRGLHRKNRVDSIIVDPPRKGLSKEVRSFLIKSGVSRILYVSCDPVTMARDISELKDNGYKLINFKAFDFYPHTTHIESFGVLDLV